jgi:acyl-CoA thioester hydrolase
MPAEEPLYAETTFHVRFAETDQMGIVHHAAYFVYFEEGRSALSRQHGVPYSRLEKMGYSLALAEAEARYVAPARYDERVTVRTWVEALRSRGITYRYEVVRADDGQVLVTGRTKHVCIDREGRVCRIPADWLAPLSAEG